MSTRFLMRASILAAVAGAVALFFAVGLRRAPRATSAPPPAASAPATTR